ncbi:MAG: chemotaxis protein CheA [Planctomycetales bacterium]|nr:chemotaxis protein CheA [Planctomycetales bacterium]
MDDFEDIIKEFLVESYENLDKLDDDLLALEDTPSDRERIASIFRTVHTIKGTSGFLALPKLERVTHVGESLLAPLRDGQLKLNRPIADALLEMVDAIRGILRRVEQDGEEGDGDYDLLVQRLEAALDEPTAGEMVDEVPPVDLDSPAKTSIPADITIATGKPTQSIADSSIRIDVALLDRLMNLVGELVLARNQIIQFSGVSNDAPMIAASQRLNLITSELQEGVMKTRMQPIRQAWNSLPRMVRDLAVGCGKKVEFRTEGEDTEIDKTVLEAIKGPLTHIVRNAIDHGIELPQARVADGKSCHGTLLMRAYHEGGQVIVEISDDGAGIDPGHIAQKAIESEIVTRQQVDAMTERDIINLILMPGFSTADSVTNVSGRGVGMDVVKTNVEAIGGSLEIQSVIGVGTTLRIKIPLTLAIIPALLVKSGGERYAIPQISLLELVRIDVDRVEKVVQFIHDAPVFRLREMLLPLVFLDEQLGLHERRQFHDDLGNLNIVVLRAEDKQFGLVVNEITDTQEIVVKPISLQLKRIPIYAGATIMGDGNVSLILDVIGLAEQSGVLVEHHCYRGADNQIDSTTPNSPPESLLIVDSANRRAAIRLSTVARLEKFSISDVELAQGRHVVQYRGRIIPLIGLDGALDARINGSDSIHADRTARLHTVVYHEGPHVVGVVVDRIVDIIQRPKIDDGNPGETQVIHNRVTEFIDLRSRVEAALSGDRTAKAGTREFTAH